MRDDPLYPIEYGYWFNTINERAYHHIDVLLNLVQLVGGSAAALAAIQEQPELVVASGLALAVCAALALLVQPGIKAEQHRASKVQWLKLKGRALTMDDPALRAAMAEIQGEGLNGLSLLVDVAYNATLRARGNEHGVVPLSWPQRLMAMLA